MSACVRVCVCACLSACSNIFECAHAEHLIEPHSVFSRNTNDKNKILLTSFFLHDIPEHIKNSIVKDKTPRTTSMYHDMSSFLEGVWKNVKNNVSKH